MNVRLAILKAADRIEQNPKDFNFHTVRVPDEHSCGSPGCALGWIGTYAKVTAGTPVAIVARDVLGVTEYEFYCRLGRLFTPQWHRCADTCAHALRMYADEYFPVTERPTQDLVDDLMKKVLDTPIPEEANEHSI